MGAVAALTAVSVGTTLVSSMQQSNAYKMQAAYEKNAYDWNARIAEIQAQDAVDRGEKAANELKKNTRRLIGAQRAALAAQGIAIDEGDALDIQLETAELGAADAQEIKNNAWREAWGYRVNALDLRGKGSFAELSGKTAARNTLLTGGMNIAKDLAYGAYLNERKTVPRYSDYDYEAA